MQALCGLSLYNLFAIELSKKDWLEVRAKELRKNPSVAEAVVWKAIRKKQFGFKFRRQVVQLNYILDFYCPELKVCLELDGEQHDLERDTKRDQDLLKIGIVTYRIPNIEFFEIHETNENDWLLGLEKLLLSRSKELGLK